MLEALTKNGRKVYLCFNEDCEDNEGGYWVEVYTDKDLNNRIDDFCIHPDDCNCSDMFEVEECAKTYVKNQDYNAGLTEEQKRAVHNFVYERMANLTSTYTEEVTNAVIEDIISDIEECADWSSLEEDEYCEDDIVIALDRVIYNRLCTE